MLNPHHNAKQLELMKHLRHSLPSVSNLLRSTDVVEEGALVLFLYCAGVKTSDLKLFH